MSEQQTLPHSESKDSARKPHTWKHWSLESVRGRQRWLHTAQMDWNSLEGRQYLDQLDKDFTFDTSQNPNSADRIYRPDADNYHSKAADAQEALTRGWAYYGKLQTADGNWPGDYGGPHFLLPGMVIVSYITGAPIDEPRKVLMKRYMLNHQNEDGGWGLHIEGHSTMFGTVLQYVSLRILGMDPQDPQVIKARNWIRRNGGATGLPPWGKFYLSCLGAYDWKGSDSLFPEAWILPRWLPIHPTRYWNHARMVYMPMAYCAAVKLTGEETPLILELRKELYTQDYQSIDWKSARSQVCPLDEEESVSGLYKFFFSAVHVLEKVMPKAWRRKSAKRLLELIDSEDEQTQYVNVGPVNQVINTLAVWSAYGKDSEAFIKHLERWHDYLWLAEDGLKMNGYNGSQLWDTCFAGQAFLESYQEDHRPIAEGVAQYVETSRIRPLEGVTPHKHHKLYTAGWPFSTVEHGWPITDCTAEGLKTTLYLRKYGHELKEVTDRDLERAVDFLLEVQNTDGGWASYEKTGGPHWLEKLNPSRVFSDIMVDYSYVECTSASLQGLYTYLDKGFTYRQEEVEAAIDRGLDFILQKQLRDGSWYGSWAVCYTYGTWFAMEALKLGIRRQPARKEFHASMESGGQFLLSVQNANGSWGEHSSSCWKREYVNLPEGHVVNTAWACLGLMCLENYDRDAVVKGIQYLIDTQELNGDFPQQGVSGVFNATCMITYTAYRNVFPLWALARWSKS